MCRRPSSTLIEVQDGIDSCVSADIAIPNNNNMGPMSHSGHILSTVIEQVTANSRPPKAVSANTVAELVVEGMHEQFLQNLPLEDAKVVDVQKWILRWFALDDTYMNDIAVPKYVAHLIISGNRLRTLSDIAILQYLAIQNVRLCAGSGGQLYPKNVIEKLAADIVEAKRRAIQGSNGVLIPAEKGKLKRMTEESIGSNKRRRLMNESTEEDDGVDGGRRTENDTVGLNSELQAPTGEPAQTKRGSGAEDNLATEITGLELSGGFHLGSNSLMVMDNSNAKGLGKQKATEEKDPLEIWEEDDEELLVRNMENFKRIKLDSSPSENGKSSTRGSYKDKSAQLNVGASTSVQRSTPGESRSGQSVAYGPDTKSSLSSGTEGSGSGYIFAKEGEEEGYSAPTGGHCGEANGEDDREDDRTIGGNDNGEEDGNSERKKDGQIDNDYDG